MAPSLDCAVSSLLCAEENASIYCYDDYVEFGVVEEFEATWHHKKSNKKQTFKGDEQEEELLSGLPLLSDECLSLMFTNECDHLPGNDYLGRLRNGDLDLGARQEAVDWIRRVHAHFNFGPLCAYLAVNYLDRFLSTYELLGKAWMMQLLAITCLSLAAKMEETEVPLCLDLQVGDSKFVFESRTVQRMELLVLSTLKWRMQAITPFSFIDYFLLKLNGDQITSSLSIFRSTQLILGIIKGIDFLEFRPSEIAAAVAMSVVGETQKVNTEKALYELIPHLQKVQDAGPTTKKERMVKCIEVMSKSSSLNGTIPKGPSGLVPSSVPQSPICVLEASCLSYKTNNSAVGSCANSSCSSETKRRKLNRPFELEL